MRKKILITGASGFIGSFLVEEALRNDMQVYAGVRSTSKLNFLQQPNIHLVILNLSSEQELIKTFSDFIATKGPLDYIIHNAGITHAQTKEEFFEVNYQYTKNLVNALTACQMPLEKFILVSTLATYGAGDVTTFLPIRLEDEEKPLSTYARSKQVADQLVRSITNFPVLILKPTAVFGPRDKDFLRVFKMTNSGYEFSIGRHRQMISLIYVKDFARAALMLLDSSCKGKTFLISDGADYTKEELNEAIRALLNKKTIRINIPLKFLQTSVKANEKLHALWGRLPFLHSEKLNEIAAANWLCDSRSVWQELHCAPQYNLLQGMEETLKWYKEKKWLQ